MNPTERQAQLVSEVETGERAKALADHPELNRALDELEAHYVAKWRSDLSLTHEGREALWYALQGAVNFRQHLRAQISSGQVAIAAIDRMAKQPRR